MIYLIYGSDYVSARSFLLNLKKNYSDHILISGKRLKASSLNLPLEENLFGEKKLLIIEDFIPKESEPLQKTETSDVVILTDEVVTVPRWVDKSWLFKQNDSLSNFKLADQIVEGQEKQALLTLTKLLKQKTPSELIIGSLVRQFRLLSLSLYGEVDSISKSPFLRDKTQKQARNWTIKKIKNALLLILKADFEIKNGIIAADSALIILINKLAVFGKVSS